MNFVVDHGQFGAACRVCTTPDECDNGGCLAYQICACGEREDICGCAYCSICGEENCCEDTHDG